MVDGPIFGGNQCCSAHIADKSIPSESQLLKCFQEIPFNWKISICCTSAFDCLRTSFAQHLVSAWTAKPVGRSGHMMSAMVRLHWAWVLRILFLRRRLRRRCGCFAAKGSSRCRSIFTPWYQNRVCVTRTHTAWSATLTLSIRAWSREWLTPNPHRSTDVIFDGMLW